MFGPKSRPTSTVAVKASGTTSASIAKKPAIVSVSVGSRTSSSSTALRLQSSQSSLLAGGIKSTSRSSVMSDTSARSLGSSLTQPVSVTKKAASTTKSSGCTSKLPATKITIGTARSRGPSSIVSTSSTSSSPSTSSSVRRVPTLAMSLRDKDQQIKLLIKERDEQKFQAELMARRAEEWEEKFLQSEVEKSHVTSEADDEVVELRRLAQELEDENKRLAGRLTEKEQVISDTQFKMDELEIERTELQRNLTDKEEQLSAMEQEQSELANGKPAAQISTERAISKAKYEREIEELKEKILGRDEQMIQLRTSLEMRKNEVSNLQAHAADLERKLKIETERSERHLKRIDEINLELKAVEARSCNKIEENDMYEKQVKQLRQELRAAEEKLEQMSLARKKDVDILHNKLSAARRGSTTPTSPQPYKTPTPQDEIVRLQMELRDLKDQLIDREAELDCNRRDMDVMRRKMETRTLEVDCNNQELARRCQDLLEQNRQSEDTVKQLLKSTAEHSAQLMRATEDLKEANSKCNKLREEVNELEAKLEEQMQKASKLARENAQLTDENEDYKEQVEMLRQQVDSLNDQVGEMCEQLDLQTNSLHKDREALAKQLSQNEIDWAQMRHDLGTAKQDLRTSKLQTQEVASERDRLKLDVEMKEKYILSRKDIIETLRLELEDSRKSISDYKQKVEELRESTLLETERITKGIKSQLETLKRDCQVKSDESGALRAKCEQLQRELEQTRETNEEDELKRFDEMRQKHSAELDELRLKLKDLEEQLEDARSSTLKRDDKPIMATKLTRSQPNERPSSASSVDDYENASAAASAEGQVESVSTTTRRKQDYESQIEFLNSVVVDMQRKCDDYKNRLAQIETINIMNEFDNLVLSSQQSTLRRNNNSNQDTTGAKDTLKRATNNKQNSKEMSMTIDRPSRISGRPYCDICNVYDLHHTIHCPKVSEKMASRKIDRANNNNDYVGANNDNNNNKNNNTNSINGGANNSDDIFREYEQSMESVSARQFCSLRRANVEKPPRPYCDHCDLFGHTVKSCNSLKV